MSKWQDFVERKAVFLTQPFMASEPKPVSAVSAATGAVMAPLVHRAVFGKWRSPDHPTIWDQIATGWNAGWDEGDNVTATGLHAIASGLDNFGIVPNSAMSYLTDMKNREFLNSLRRHSDVYVSPRPKTGYNGKLVPMVNPDGRFEDYNSLLGLHNASSIALSSVPGFFWGPLPGTALQVAHSYNEGRREGEFERKRRADKVYEFLDSMPKDSEEYRQQWSELRPFLEAGDPKRFSKLPRPEVSRRLGRFKLSEEPSQSAAPSSWKSYAYEPAGRNQVPSTASIGVPDLRRAASSAEAARSVANAASPRGASGAPSPMQPSRKVPAGAKNKLRDDLKKARSWLFG